MFKSILASLMLVGSLSFGEESAVVLTTFGGLNDTDSPAVIEGSPDLINVEANIKGSAILKRKGFSREAALTYSTSPVVGSYSFYSNAGDRISIVCHDVYCAKSTNGSAFTNFLTTATHPTKWSFVDIDGILYMANDARDKIGIYNGTTLSYSTTIPQGSLLELSEDRLIVSDTAANPNRIHYSKSGSYAHFTTGIQSVDSYTDDLGSPGDRVTCLVHDKGRLVICKRNSITTCILGDQYTSECRLFSSSIGSSDPDSFVSAPDGLYFVAQDKHYWKIGPNGLEQLSKKLSNFVKSQPSGMSANNTQTTQVDWEAGTQITTGTWETGLVSGSIFPSSVAFIDTSGVNWSSGTFNDTSSQTFSGLISLAVSSINATLDDFTDGNFSSNPTWTFGTGTNDWSAGTGILRYSNGGPGNDVGTLYTSTAVVSYGDWSISTRLVSPGGSPAGFAEATIYFLFGSSDTSTGSGYALFWSGGPSPMPVNLYRVDVGALTLIGSDTTALSSDKTCVLKISRTHNGLFTVTSNTAGCTDINFTATDTVYTSGTHYVLKARADGSSSATTDVFYDDIKTPTQYYPVYGRFGSQIFDTHFSTPTWGAFSSTFTVSPGETAISFYTIVSNDGVSFDTEILATDNKKVTSAQKRFIKYFADLTTTKSTKTATIDEVGLLAATTGQYITQCIQPGSNISSWGLLSCTESITGNASIVYAATSTPNCNSIAPSSWTFTTQVNNTALTVSTKAAVYLRFTSLLTSATEQARIDACTLYWNNGVVSPPVSGVFDSINNAIFWTAAINNSSYNNRVIKYDLNLNEFFPFDLAANALKIIDNSVYFGSSNGGYWNKYGASGVDSDNGSAINAYWKSRDFSGEDPFREKTFQKISVIARNQGSGSATVTYTTSDNSSGSYSVSLATTAGVNYIRKNYFLPRLSPHTFMNVKFSNNVANGPFEILGLRLDYFIQPWRTIEK